jgi:hypothetical protein
MDDEGVDHFDRAYEFVPLRPVAEEIDASSCDVDFGSSEGEQTNQIMDFSVASIGHSLGSTSSVSGSPHRDVERLRPAVGTGTMLTDARGSVCGQQDQIMSIAVSFSSSSPRRDVERLRAAIGIDKMPTDTDAWGAFALVCSVCGQQGFHTEATARCLPTPTPGVRLH